MKKSSSVASIAALIFGFLFSVPIWAAELKPIEINPDLGLNFKPT